jgi:hypothetical protein
MANHTKGITNNPFGRPRGSKNKLPQIYFDIQSALCRGVSGIDVTDLLTEIRHDSKNYEKLLPFLAKFIPQQMQVEGNVDTTITINKIDYSKLVKGEEDEEK